MKKKPLLKDFNWRKFIVILSVFTVLTFLPIVVYLYLSKTIQSVAYTVVEDFTTLDLINQVNSSNYDISGGTLKTGSNEYNFGTGADGACTVSINKNINTGSCTGRANGDAVNFSVTSNVSAGSNSVTLSSTPTGLAVGDEILIINLQGTSTNYSDVGEYETAYITQINSNTLTLDSNLTNGYNGTTQKIMVQRIPQYTNVTVNSGYSFYPSAWNGTKGGVMMFKANGTVTVNGTIHANALGYRGGTATSWDGGTAGETYGGYGGGKGGKYNVDGSNGVISGGGGGGAHYGLDEGAGGLGTDVGGSGGGGGCGVGEFGYKTRGGAGGGGGYGSGGLMGTGGWGDPEDADDGTATTSGKGGRRQRTSNGRGYGGGGGGGGGYGVADLTKLYFGSGGGAGGAASGYAGGNGGVGGGIVYLGAQDITVNAGGYIKSNGGSGLNSASYGGWNCGNDRSAGGGGGSAGGSVYLLAEELTIGTVYVTGSGGAGGLGNCDNGGAGGVGRIAIEYIISLSGTTSPSASTIQLPAYADTMFLQSTDLISETNNVGIQSFSYILSSKPINTLASIQFSTDALTWFNSNGVEGADDELILGENTQISLEPLNLKTSEFYYKITFDTNSGQDTPVLDSVSLTYNAAPDTPTIGTPQALSTDTIRWNFTDNATNEEGFALYDADNNLIKYCLGENLAYCDENGLDENTQYARSVRAYNSSGESASSELAYSYTLVSVPTILEGGSKTVSSLTLSALGQVNGSEIYFDCTGTACDTGISEWIAGSTDEVINLDFNTPYAFVVKGRNGDNVETANSESITIYTLAQTPSLTLTPLSSSSITLTAQGVNNVSDGTSGAYFECEEVGCNEGIKQWVQSVEGVVTGLNPNALYFFRVKSRNYDGIETEYSDYVGTYTKSGIPAVPKVVSQTTNSITIALGEDSNPEGTQYAILEEVTGKYVDILTGALVDDPVWGTYTQFGLTEGKEVVGLDVGTEYTFKSKSRNEDDIESEFSESVTVATKMYAPTSLSALTTTSSSFTWRVTDGNESKTGYRIYDTENNLLVTCLVSQMNDCKEENLLSNTEYPRKVKVFSNISESDYSNTFLFTTYSNPSSISSVTALSDSAIRLSVSGDSKDNLQIAENNSNRYYSNNLKVLTTTSSIIPYSSTIDVDGLLPNTQYEFKVRSLNKKNIATAWSSNESTYTHSQVPAMVKVDILSSSSARMVINPLTNPSDTEFLIRENNSGRYINFNTGTLVSQEVWGTFANFGATSGVVISGLEVGVQYGFSVRSRNKLLVPSDWSDGIFIGTGAILQNVNSSLVATLATQENIDLTNRNNAQFGEKSVRIKKGEFLIADIPVLFNQDRDWNDAIILSSTDERKTVVKLRPTHGVSKPYTMYVNRDDTNGFLLCPGASTLEQVTENCSGGVRFTGPFPSKKSVEGVEVTVSQTVIGGVDYWVADGITGTGGLAFYHEETVEESDDETPPSESESSKEDTPILDTVKKTTYGQRITDVFRSGYEALSSVKDSALGILDNTVVKDLKEGELRTVSATANVVTVTVGTTAIIGGLTQLGYSIMQFIAVLLSTIGFRKKRVNYGFVYDSNSKEPVHMALVRIYDKGKKIVDTAVTDVNGRFSASLKKGKYTLEVSKSGYEFPSMYIKGHVDYPLQNVYIGKLDIPSEDSDIQVAVPIDPKEVLGARMIFNSIKNVILRILSVVNIFIFILGLIISFYTYFTYQSSNNLILLLLYVVPFIVLVRSFLNRKGRYGRVVDEKGHPLSGISLTIKEKEFDKVIAKRVTNAKGKYRFILDKGKYELGIRDKGYELVDVKRGALIDVRRNNYVLGKKVVIRKI